MNGNDQCNRCGIDRDVHDLRPAPDHAFVEPIRAEAREMRLLPNDRKEAAKYKAVFPSGGVPWSLLAPHEEQAMQNHGQTLERLSERGGLGPEEMLSIVKDRRYSRVSDNEALAQLKALVEAAEPAPQPAPSGDEAKVREIASEDDVLFKIAKEWTSGDYGRMVSAVRAAYAAGKADGAREVDHLKDLINRDKTGLALGLNKIQRIAKGFDWICEGRGPYEYDDDRYRMEVGSLIVQVLAVAKEHLNASGELADEAFHPRAKETVRALADVIARRGSEGT